MNTNFTDKELRDLFNLEKTYDLIVDVYQQLNELLYCLFEKNIKNYKYLYIQKTKESKPTSIGVMNEENQKKLFDYNEQKRKLLLNYNNLTDELQENIKYAKITKANKIDSKVANILRKMDANKLLGTDFLVVGTNAFFVYEIHAQQLLFKDNLSTDDLYFTYYFEQYKTFNKEAKTNQHKLIKILKDIDETFNINHKKMFQAINSVGYEVEVLASP